MAYRKVLPTASQKAAAHDFYSNEEARPDLPKSDLRSFLDAALYRERPSRAVTRAEDPYAYGVKSSEPALGLQHTSDLRGQLTARDAILQFVRAGNATLTVVSRATGTRFTYQFQRPKNFEPTPDRPNAPVFCKVMTSADNESDFEFVGTMWPERIEDPDGPQVYRHSAKARITLGAPSVKALVWFLRSALHPTGADALEKCEVWHEGRCGRCGRKLTVPSSVESGYGPECIGRL
jgi:hypothetical protein